MLQQLLPALRITLALTLLTGLVYPLVVTGVCQLAFPRQANGSLLRTGNRTFGSELIGQNFARPEYFHSRPSAVNYDAASSGASNLGPTNKKLAERVRASEAQFRKENPAHTGPVPADMLTTSASGLDPHISPEAAQAQAARVATARGVDANAMQRLVAEAVEPATLGFIGEPRVNVLRLNLALDQRFPAKR